MRAIHTGHSSTLRDVNTTKTIESCTHLAAWDVDDPAPWCAAIRDTVSAVFAPMLRPGEELWLFGSVVRVITGDLPGRWPADTDVAVIGPSRQWLDSELYDAAWRVGELTGSPVHLTVVANDTADTDKIVRSQGLRLA